MKHSPSTYTNNQSQWQALNNVIANLNTIGIHGILAKDLSRLLPDDDTDPALNIMAEVRAYFQGKPAFFLQLRCSCDPSLLVAYK